jgi:glutaminase
MGPLQHDDAPYVSTGQLPSPEQVRRAVDEAYERYRAAAGGERSRIYPALSRVPADLFGICTVGTRGGVYATGDADHGFAIMSVAKPFVFALVCQALGPEEARDRLGANATGLAFNSLAAVERGPDGRTNPMVNAGGDRHRQPDPRRQPGRTLGVPPRGAVAVRGPAAGPGRGGVYLGLGH